MSFSPRTVVGTLIATALFSSHALAAKGGNAKLTLASSKVTVAGHPASVGSTIAPGETIVTGAHSRAEVTLSDGTVARIGQGSSFSFDGSKLTLNQGSALFNITGKSSKIVTPALVRTGSAGVVSVHASQSYNALFALKGSDTVNGSPLVAGQAWVSESGGPRTFTFDMQKMVGTSTLVTKFPQTPWVAQTTALASVQHQLIAALKSQPAPGSQRPLNTVVTNGSTNPTVGRSDKPPGFLGGLLSLFSGKSATSGSTLNAVSQTARGNNTAGGLVKISSGSLAGSLTLNGAITSSGTAGAVTFSGATLNLGGSGGAVYLLNGSQFNAGTLSLGNGNVATLAAGSQNVLNAGNGTIQFGIVNTTSDSIVTNAGFANTFATLKPNNNAVINFNGANTATAAGAINSTVNTLAVQNWNSTGVANGASGTLILNSDHGFGLGNSVNGNNVVFGGNFQIVSVGGTSNTATNVQLLQNAGNLVLPNGANPPTISIPNGSNTAGSINGVSISTLQPGQNVTFGGISYTVGNSPNGTLTLTPPIQTGTSARLPLGASPVGR